MSDPDANGPSGRTERAGESWAGYRARTERVVPYLLAVVSALVLVLVTLTRSEGTSTAQDVLGDQQLQIMAPAAPGGGWDQTSREMQGALQDLIGRSEVYNVDGAGGTIGLSQLPRYRGQPNLLMTTGLIMVGAIAANDARVTLEQSTPLARLTTDSQVIVVPADSEIRTIDDLTERMRSDLPSVSIAGGSAGGAEQILAGLVAEELGRDPAKVNYVAHSGGGEAVATLLSGSAVAGISGISEMKPQIDAGTMRPLAVSSEERIDLLPDVPTLIESGYDVELTNWRGVVAPPGITEREEKVLEDLIMQMTETEQWQRTLEREGWTDVALAGPEFEEFLEAETRRTEQVIDDLGIGSGS